MIDIRQGDCLDVMNGMADCSVDAVVTDPPYGLAFMGKRWDYDVPSVEIWAECLRVLKPGGHLLAFAGTRTQHRMAVRIEDAGFEIRDMIAWVYGSGFPKSLNGPWGGTALKPAMEPITMARKPLIGTVAENVLAHGTGGLNIDGCRVEFQGEDDKASAKPGGKTTAASGNLAGKAQGGAGRAEFEAVQGAGRWPANLIHDGSDEVVGLFPESKGQQGDVRGTEPSGVTNGIYGTFAGRVASPARNDSGSAARFFYCAKASKAERGEGNNHPTVKPIDLMRYLCRLVTPPGGIVLDPFMGSGSTGKAAALEGFRFIGIEREPAYVEISRARIDHVSKQGALL